MKKVESLEMRLWVVLLVAVLAVVCFLPEDSQAEWRKYSGRARKGKYHIEKRPPKRHGSTKDLPEVTTDINSTNGGRVNDQMGTPNLEEQQLGQAGNQTQPEDSDYDLESDQEDSLEDVPGAEQAVSDPDPEQQVSPGDDEGAEETDQDSKSANGSSFEGVPSVQPGKMSQPGKQGGSGQQGQSGLWGYSGVQKWQQGGPGGAQWGGQGRYPSHSQQWGRQWSGQQLRIPWHRQAPRNNVQDALHTIEHFIRNVVGDIIPGPLRNALDVVKGLLGFQVEQQQPGGWQGQGQGGYPAKQGGYPAGQVGYPAGQVGYPGGQVGYPGGQVGYPGGQVGYPAGQGGYPAGQVGYPAGQVGYPAGQVGYPAGQGGYPAGQVVYPPAQLGYPAAQVGYPGNYGAKPGGYQPTNQQNLRAQPGTGASVTQNLRRRANREFLKSLTHG